jgi:hypothetical protein
MSPLDASVIQEYEFPDPEWQDHSERLSYEVVEERRSLRSRFLFVVLASSSLWLSIALGGLVII